jgi:hypothetical protein
MRSGTSFTGHIFDLSYLPRDIERDKKDMRDILNKYILSNRSSVFPE